MKLRILSLFLLGIVTFTTGAIAQEQVDSGPPKDSIHWAPIRVGGIYIKNSVGYVFAPQISLSPYFNQPEIPVGLRVLVGMAPLKTQEGKRFYEMECQALLSFHTLDYLYLEVGGGLQSWRIAGKGTQGIMTAQARYSDTAWSSIIPFLSGLYAGISATTGSLPSRQAHFGVEFEF